MCDILKITDMNEIYEQPSEKSVDSSHDDKEANSLTREYGARPTLRPREGCVRRSALLHEVTEPCKEKRPAPTIHPCALASKVRVTRRTRARPGPGVRRRQWPARGMHERPEWPLSIEVLSPKPKPAPLPMLAPTFYPRSPDNSPTTCSLRRSMQLALHAALAFGAEVLQDLKEETESRKKASLSPDKKMSFLPHTIDQFCNTHPFQNILDTISQSQNIDLSQNSDGQSSVTTQMSDMDSSSDPLDLSDESMDSDYNEVKYIPQNQNPPEIPYKNALNNENKDSVPVVEHISEIQNKFTGCNLNSKIYEPFPKVLLEQQHTSAELLARKLTQINEVKANPLPVQVIKTKPNENNMFLVTGHFDKNNTFCITSSTEFKNVEESITFSHLQKSVDKSKSTSSDEDYQDYKFSSPHNLLKTRIPNSSSLINRDPRCSFNEFNPVESSETNTTNISRRCLQDSVKLNTEKSIQGAEIELKDAETRNDPKSSVPILVKGVSNSFLESRENNSQVIIIPVDQKTPSVSAGKKIVDYVNSNLTEKYPHNEQIYLREHGNKPIKSDLSVKKTSTIDLISNSAKISNYMESKNKFYVKESYYSLRNTSVKKQKHKVSPNMEISFGLSNTADSTTQERIFNYPNQNSDTHSFHMNKMEKQFPSSTFLLEEADKFLHIVSMKGRESNSLDNENKYDNVIKNNSVNFDSTSSPMENMNSQSQVYEEISENMENENELEKPEDESINDDRDNSSTICSDYDRKSKEEDTNNSTIDFNAKDNYQDENEEMRVSDIIDGFVPFILQRAIHYCMICDVAPEDLLAYFNSLSPASIPDWLE